MKPDPFTRWQLGLALLALALSVAWIVDAVFWDPQVPFLTRTGDPDWIGLQTEIQTLEIHIDLENVPVQTFLKDFTLDEVAAEVRVHIRTLGDGELRVNEEVLWRSRADASWKRDSVVDATHALEVGKNEIRVAVANARGPALVQLRFVGADGESIVETNASWRAVDDRSRPSETMRADDTRFDPQSVSMPSTGSVLVERAVVLGLLFVFGAIGYLVIRRTASDRVLSRTPEIVLAAATVFWLLVYTLRSTGLPVAMGFDILGHLAYIDFLLERRALPLATDGWSMYHPPLGHALIAGIVVLFDLAREDAAARWLYRLPTFLAGLGNVWATWFISRRLFADDPLRISLSVGFAALLPMNLYMSAYVSNEPLHSFLVSLSLCAACALLIRSGTSSSGVAMLSASLGLAILTKFTALVAVPLSAGFLAWKMWWVDRESPARALTVTTAMLAGVAAVGGWVYFRNWQVFGRPVIGNWDVPASTVWWQQPGFHTWSYYTSFGHALSQPFFAGRTSFWDSVYSTLWGDGLAAGMTRLATRHDAWNYDFMTAGYWLAFPASLLAIAGLGRAVHYGLSESDLGRRLAMSLLVTFLYAATFALFAITFELAYYGQAKAFYVLCAIVPVSLIAGLGLSWLPERLVAPIWAPIRILYWGWLATLAGSLVLAFLG